jgi:hypothetical protein
MDGTTWRGDGAQAIAGPNGRPGGAAMARPGVRLGAPPDFRAMARPAVGADAPGDERDHDRAREREHDRPAANAEGRRRVRLYVALDPELHRKVGAWAAWTGADVSDLVGRFLRDQVEGFEVRSGG